MKTIDRYHKWVEWSEEDQVYLGKCPDLITGIHGDDPVVLYAELCETIAGIIRHFEENGERTPEFQDPPDDGAGLIDHDFHRTGWTTIRELLRASMPDSEEGLRNKQLSQHATANEIAARIRQRSRCLFPLCIRPQPMDRLWSWYSMRRSATGDTRMTFDAFLDLWIPPHGSLVLSSQTDSLCSPSGELLVDTLGRYENFAFDLKAIFKRAELPLPLEIPCLNSSGAGHYSRFYSVLRPPSCRTRLPGGFGKF